MRLTLENLTETGANTLAPGRERKCLPHSHLSYMEVMLAYVRGCPLGHKLRHLVSVVGHFAFNLHIYIVSVSISCIWNVHEEINGMVFGMHN
jgi:hypothetical protein